MHMYDEVKDSIMSWLVKGPLYNSQIVQATGYSEYRVRLALLQLQRSCKVELFYDPLASQGWWKYRIANNLD